MKDKILNATPLELTIINHELLLDRINQAMEASPKSEALTTALKKSRDALAVLYETLDMRIELSEDLESLYLFINSLLIKSDFIRDDTEKTQTLSHAKQIIEELLSAWRALHQNPSLQKPAPQIITGLTYDKHGNLTEYHAQDYDPHSGYKI
jgi:flagellin-specific chaperone FliS